MRTRSLLALGSATVFALAATAQAADILVPRDRTLRDALIAAEAGDRVIVTGGTYRNGRISQPNVTLVGKGARLSGIWEISSPGATVEGVSFIDAEVKVTGEGATFRRCRFLAPRGQRVFALQFRAENVTGLVIEDCRSISTALVAIDCPGLIFRGNRLLGGEVSADGDLLLFEDNVLTEGAQIGAFSGTDIVVSRNRASSLFVGSANRALIEDNTIAGGGVEVSGDSVRIVRNRLSRGWGMRVRGEDAEVAENDLGFRSPSRGGGHGLTVEGARARVTDNVLANPTSGTQRSGALLLVSGQGPATVRRNKVSHTGAGGIRVLAPGSDVSSNVIEGFSCVASIEIEGASCTVTDNDIVQSGSRIGYGSGIVVEGLGAVLTGNTVSGARYDGVVIDGADCTISGGEISDSGRCGITITENARTTSIQLCAVTGAKWAALYVLGDDTSASGSSFTGGGRIDVLDFGRDTDLGNSTFGTQTSNEGLKPFK